MRKSCRLLLGVLALVTVWCTPTCAEVTEEGASAATFVLLKPETSFFWRTCPGSTLAVPVDFPPAASEATLAVTGQRGYAQTYVLTRELLRADGCFVLSLPEAVDAASENLYRLTLAFNDAACTTRSAELGLISGLSAESEGTTRCLLPKGDKDWSKLAKRHALLPIPYGTTAVFVDGVKVDEDPEGSARWYYLGCSHATVRLQGAETLEEQLGSIPGTVLVVK